MGCMCLSGSIAPLLPSCLGAGPDPQSAGESWVELVDKFWAVLLSYVYIYIYICMMYLYDMLHPRGIRKSLQSAGGEHLETLPNPTHWACEHCGYCVCG